MPSILHIQQGGSSEELYLHIHEDQAESDECRKECVGDGYRVSDDLTTTIEMTKEVQALLDDVIDLVFTI